MSGNAIFNATVCVLTNAQISSGCRAAYMAYLDDGNNIDSYEYKDGRSIIKVVL